MHAMSLQALNWTLLDPEDPYQLVWRMGLESLRQLHSRSMEHVCALVWDCKITVAGEKEEGPDVWSNK